MAKGCEVKELRKRLNRLSSISERHRSPKSMFRISDIQELVTLLDEAREIVFGFTQFQPEEQTEEMFVEANAWLKKVKHE